MILIKLPNLHRRPFPELDSIEHPLTNAVTHSMQAIITKSKNHQVQYLIKDPARQNQHS